MLFFGLANNSITEILFVFYAVKRLFYVLFNLIFRIFNNRNFSFLPFESIDFYCNWNEKETFVWIEPKIFKLLFLFGFVYFILIEKTEYHLSRTTQNKAIKPVAATDTTLPSLNGTRSGKNSCGSSEPVIDSWPYSFCPQTNTSPSVETANNVSVVPPIRDTFTPIKSPRTRSGWNWKFLFPLPSWPSVPRPQA